MEKQFVTYDLALRLKILGFDEPCFAFFGPSFEYAPENKLIIARGDCLQSNIEDAPTAPLWQQAFDWLKEQYKLYGWSTSKTIEGDETIYIPHGRTIPDTIKNKLVVDLIPYTTSKSSYDANRICLEHLISIVEKRLK